VTAHNPSVGPRVRDGTFAVTDRGYNHSVVLHTAFFRPEYGADEFAWEYGTDAIPSYNSPREAIP